MPSARTPRGASLGGWVPALLAVTIAAAYSNGLTSGFHFDDWHVLEQNPHIRTLASIPRFFVDPNTTTVLRENKDLRPVLLTSFAVNYAISGDATWSYHALNLLLHLLVALLVFRIVRDHLFLDAERVPVAAAAALVVAVHPLNTEAVNYLSARSALLTAAFYLGAFDAAARDRRPRCLALFALALLTKAIAVTLPFAVVGHWLLGRRSHVGGRPPRTPWAFFASLVGLALAGLVYRRALLPAVALEATHQTGVTPWVYCMTEWSAYLYYLRLFLWPDALVVDRLDYPYARSLVDPRAWGSLLVLLTLAALAWRARGRRPALTFAALWYLVALAAESTVFPLAEPVNEHRTYLGMLGLGTAAGLGLTAVARIAAGRDGRSAGRAFATLLALLVLVLGGVTFARNRTWRDDYALWIDATEKAPRNPRAWLNAGHAAMARGDIVDARRKLLQARRLSPCYAYVQLNLSALDARAGDLAGALQWADEAVRCNPDLALARYYHGAALERLGRLDAALGEYRQATALDDQHADAWTAAGRLLERRQEWAAAAAAYDRALAANPTLGDAAMLAGLAYQHRLGESEHAIERYRTVLRLNPGHYGAHYQLAVALLAAGRNPEAVAAWREFVQLALAIGDRRSIDGAPEALRRAVPSS